MTVIIRMMEERDAERWTGLRCELWPEHSAADHARDLADFLKSPTPWGFIAETADGTTAGFAEAAVRPYANGCDSRPVPFLEGIWIAPAFRRTGVGRQLIAHIETFVRDRGFRELGSDALLDNADSHAAHQGWGFTETERVVYFRKTLTD